MSAAYEVDLWKRIASLRSAAELDALATREDLEAFALILTGDIADTWYSIVEQQAHLQLVHEQLEISETFLELVELRFSQGQASAVEVYQQREQVASTQAHIPPAESRLQVQQHKLAVLLGRAPTDTVTPTRIDLPDLPRLPDMGLPAALLQRRPDVRLAQARVAAANYRVAAAVADRFPSLRLGASRGYQNDEIHEVFSNWIWSLAGNLVTPLIDGDRRAAEVDRTRAGLQETLSEYEKAILRALRDVEDALVQERFQRAYLEQLNREVEFARAALRESRERYAVGLIEYLPVLTELQSVQRIERDILTAAKNLIWFRIQLYKSMGGSWTSTLERQGAEVTLGLSGEKR